VLGGISFFEEGVVSFLLLVFGLVVRFGCLVLLVCFFLVFVGWWGGGGGGFLFLGGGRVVVFVWFLVFVGGIG